MINSRTVLIEIKIVGKNNFPVFLLKNRILHKLYMAVIEPCCYLFSSANVGEFFAQPVQVIVVETGHPFVSCYILPCSEVPNGSCFCLLNEVRISSQPEAYHLNSVYFQVYVFSHCDQSSFPFRLMYAFAFLYLWLLCSFLFCSFAYYTSVSFCH